MIRAQIIVEEARLVSLREVSLARYIQSTQVRMPTSSWSLRRRPKHERQTPISARDAAIGDTGWLHGCSSGKARTSRPKQCICLDDLKAVSWSEIAQPSKEVAYDTKLAPQIVEGWSRPATKSSSGSERLLAFHTYFTCINANTHSTYQVQ